MLIRGIIRTIKYHIESSTQAPQRRAGLVAGERGLASARQNSAESDQDRSSGRLVGAVED